MIAEKLVNISTIPALYPDKKCEALRRALTQKMSAVWLSEQVIEFFRKHALDGIDDPKGAWTNSEKNKFFTTYKDNPHLSDIINSFNRIYKDRCDYKISYSKPENLLEKLCKIDQINQFLKAYPYSDPVFCREINKRAIELGITGNNSEVLTNIENALSVGLSKNEIIEFIDKDCSPEQNFIEKMKDAQIIARRNSASSLFMSGLMTISLPIINEAGIKKVVADGSEAVQNAFKYFYESGHVFGQADIPTIISDKSFVGMLAVTFALVSTWKVIESRFSSINESVKSKKINNYNPNDIDINIYKENIAKNLMSPLIHRKEYNASDEKNKSHLLLTAFCIEKLHNPSLKIEDLQLKLRTSFDLRLRIDQINHLNNLTENQLHEISSLRNPQIRDLFMKNDLSFKQKITLKNLDACSQIVGFKFHDKGFPFLGDSGGIGKKLRSEIKEAFAKTPIEREIMQEFIKISLDDDGKCHEKELNFIVKMVQSNKLQTPEFLDELVKQIHERYAAIKKAAPQGGFLGVFREQEGTFRLDTNIPVKDVFRDVSLQCGLVFAEKITNFYDHGKKDAFIQQSKLSIWLASVNLASKTLVKDNIEKLRKKVFYTPTPPSGPQTP